jgi:hypothetical protein
MLCKIIIFDENFKAIQKILIVGFEILLIKLRILAKIPFKIPQSLKKIQIISCLKFKIREKLI